MQRPRQDAGVLSAMLGCDSVGIAVTDRGFRYLLWNRFMEDFTGLAAGEVLGRNALEVYPHLREEGLERALARVLGGETVTAPDAPYRIPAAGRRGWVSAQYAPHRGPGGEVLGVVGILTDVTERKRAEDESRRLAAIPRESPSPMLECEPGGAVRYANPAALRLADELGVRLECDLLPEQHRLLTAWCARHGRPRVGIETEAAGRVFSWAYHPQPGLGVVHLFGEDATARREEPRWVLVDVRARYKVEVLTLAQLRDTPELQDMIVLKRGNRLSITPVDPAHWKRLLKMMKKVA